MSSEIILGDCIETLRDMADASVDAIVTDPPFGIGFAYSHGKDVARDPTAYGEWLQPILREFERVVRPGGLIAVWQAQPYFRRFWDWFGDDIHIYCSAKNFVQLRKVAINYGYDPVVMRYKAGASPLRPPKPHRSLDFFVANTAAVVSKKDRIEKAHPCPRPLDAVTEIVDNFTLPGGIVLDPFAGSGTTLLACLTTGRSCIGIEREAAYVNLARRRVAAAEQAETNRQVGEIA